MTTLSITPRPSANITLQYPPLPTGIKLLNLLVLLSSLNACSSFKLFDDDLATPQMPEVPATSTIESHEFTLSEDHAVLGKLATVPIREGDTLSDLARHYGLGLQHLSEANPSLEPWTPLPGAQTVLPTQFILPDAPRKGIVINLASMRLFYFAHPDKLITYPVGIGKEGRSTPTGSMKIERKTQHPVWYVPESIRNDHARKGDPLPASVPAGPDNPLGDYAFYLSEPSYLIHGTNKPYSIGLRASNGCIRLYPENIDELFKRVPEKTPVKIVNQPYLFGTLDGLPYVEAHEPYEEVNDKQTKKNFVQKLKQWEKKQHQALDWPKIETTLQQALGIPVPILENSPTVAEMINQAVSLNHPEHLYLQPESDVLPSSKAWYVLAEKDLGPLEAQRLAAMLNHQGPRIPALSVEHEGRYQVLTGPFSDAKSAKASLKRMKIDLELAGKIIPPAEH